MFYLLRSSAITIAGSQAIAEVCFHMIAELSVIRDRLRSSAIIWKPAWAPPGLSGLVSRSIEQSRFNWKTVDGKFSRFYD